MEVSTLRLRALEGEPLRDERVRDTVIAAAHAIAERTGIALERVEGEPDSLVVTICADRLAALGFLAELRRATDAWHRRSRGGSLWGEPAAE